MAPLERGLLRQHDLKLVIGDDPRDAVQHSVPRRDESGCDGEPPMPVLPRREGVERWEKEQQESPCRIEDRDEDRHQEEQGQRIANEGAYPRPRMHGPELQRVQIELGKQPGEQSRQLRPTHQRQKRLRSTLLPACRSTGRGDLQAGEAERAAQQ